MNNFKKSLQIAVTKRIDEKISANIEEELGRLEQEVDVKEYKDQIVERKEGIRHVFVSFEHNMEMIEENNRYSVLDKSKDTRNIHERNVDKIIQKRIWQRLEKLYQNTMHYTCFQNPQEQGKELTQILDRQIRVNELLERYNENMAILEKRTKESNKQMVL